MELKLKKQKRVVGLLVLLLVLVGVYFAIPSGPAPHVHAKLKDLKLNELEMDVLYAKNGETLEDIKQKSHVLMVFFTLNCADTKTNIARLNALHQRDDIAVVGYLMAGISRAESFAKRNGVEFPIANPSLHYKQTFEPNVHPSSYLVRTSDLSVREKYVGILFLQNIINSMSSF
jgi:hypothetical protein